MREDATAPLAPVPNEAAFAPLPSPVRAFERRGDEHAVRRGVYTSPGPDGTVIEISDLIVGPRAQANLPPDRAARVLDARSGLGNALISNRKEELSPMRPISLPAGNESVVRNDGDAPLVVRIYSVRSR